MLFITDNARSIIADDDWKSHSLRTTLGGVSCPGANTAAPGAAGAAGPAGTPAAEEPLPPGVSCVEMQAAGVCVLPSPPGMVPGIVVSPTGT